MPWSHQGRLLGLLGFGAALVGGQSGCNTAECPDFWLTPPRRSDGSPEAEAEVIHDILDKEHSDRWVLVTNGSVRCTKLSQPGCDCTLRLKDTPGTNKTRPTAKYDATRAPSDDDIPSVGNSMTPGTTVHVSATVTKVGPLNLLQKTMDVALHLKMQWSDPRLRWCPDNYTGFGATTGSDEPYIYMLTHVPSVRIWRPDMLLTNAKPTQDLGSESEAWGYENTRVRHDGTVYFDRFIVRTYTCSMDFSRYPFDMQVCSVKLQSFGYTNQVLQLDLASSYLQFDRNQVLDNMAQVGVFELQAVRGVKKSMFDVTGPWYEDTLEQSTPGIQYDFVFQRNLRPYVLTAFLPLVLVVLLSCLALWINYETAPARVAAGVTTVLVMITLMFVLSKDLPLTNQLTAMDIYICFCFFLVSMNMAEYGMINYLTTRLKFRQDLLTARIKDVELLRETVTRAANAETKKRRPVLSDFLSDAAELASPLLPASPHGRQDGGGSPAAQQRRRPRLSHSVLVEKNRREVKQVFQRIVDEDGPEISTRKLREVLLSSGCSPDALEKVLARLDRNRDEFISFDEFWNFMSTALDPAQLMHTGTSNVTVRAFGCFLLTAPHVKQIERWYRLLLPCIFLLWNLGFFLVHFATEPPAEGWVSDAISAGLRRTYTS